MRFLLLLQDYKHYMQERGKNVSKARIFDSSYVVHLSHESPILSTFELPGLGVSFSLSNAAISTSLSFSSTLLGAHYKFTSAFRIRLSFDNDEIQTYCMSKPQMRIQPCPAGPWGLYVLSLKISTPVAFHSGRRGLRAAGTLIQRCEPPEDVGRAL